MSQKNVFIPKVGANLRLETAIICVPRRINYLDIIVNNFKAKFVFFKYNFNLAMSTQQ